MGCVLRGCNKFMSSSPATHLHAQQSFGVEFFAKAEHLLVRHVQATGGVCHLLRAQYKLVGMVDREDGLG